MKDYVSPMLVAKGSSEGVYLASGATYGCKSIYMKGKFQKGTYNPIKDGYKVGYGCEGCPASNGSSCKFDVNSGEMTWDADFRPFWEIHGKKPDEKGY